MDRREVLLVRRRARRLLQIVPSSQSCRLRIARTPAPAAANCRDGLCSPILDGGKIAEDLAKDNCVFRAPGLRGARGRARYFFGSKSSDAELMQ